MEYNKFCGIFNAAIFERSKSDLIRKIADHPERYIGLFRPTKPKAKIIQNLLQSHEIRYGDAFETLIEEYLREQGYQILDKRLTQDGKNLYVDQIFSEDDDVFFVEQKIRDDHDSSKKRGQMSNFEKKIIAITDAYPNANVTGLFYFIDNSFHKNRNYYEETIENLANCYGVSLHLVYGGDFFGYIEQNDTWGEIITHLTNWKKSIPDLPEINFDRDATKSFEEIKTLPTIVYRKLFSNSELDEVLRVLFPDKSTLCLLNQHFERKCQNNDTNNTIYHTLNRLCLEIINRL